MSHEKVKRDTEKINGTQLVIVRLIVKNGIIANVKKHVLRDGKNVLIIIDLIEIFKIFQT